ncbi:MAG: hypothetical protein KDD40_12515, partial [Bdellovibrionales bacterium]|nr:hypothetical protein [Bdellovibrionales bacterium]
MKINEHSLGAKILRITNMRSDDRRSSLLPQVNFKTYAEMIMEGDIKSASDILSKLFKVSKDRAFRCAMFNAEFYMNHPEAMQLL